MSEGMLDYISYCIIIMTNEYKDISFNAKVDNNIKKEENNNGDNIKPKKNLIEIDKFNKMNIILNDTPSNNVLKEKAVKKIPPRNKRRINRN